MVWVTLEATPWKRRKVSTKTFLQRNLKVPVAAAIEEIESACDNCSKELFPQKEGTQEGFE